MLPGARLQQVRSLLGAGWCAWADGGGVVKELVAEMSAAWRDPKEAQGWKQVALDFGENDCLFPLLFL